MMHHLYMQKQKKKEKKFDEIQKVDIHFKNSIIILLLYYQKKKNTK